MGAGVAGASLGCLLFFSGIGCWAAAWRLLVLSCVFRLDSLLAGVAFLLLATVAVLLLLLLSTAVESCSSGSFGSVILLREFIFFNVWYLLFLAWFFLTPDVFFPPLDSFDFLPFFPCPLPFPVPFPLPLPLPLAAARSSLIFCFTVNWARRVTVGWLGTSGCCPFSSGATWRGPMTMEETSSCITLDASCLYRINI